YQLTALATDRAGNPNTAIAQFVFDTAKPTSTITSPANGAFLKTWISISGKTNDAAAAHPAGVPTNGVGVAVKEIGTGWWNGSDFSGSNPDYSQFTIANTTTTSPNTWTFNLPGGFTAMLTNGASYQL